MARNAKATRRALLNFVVITCFAAIIAAPLTAGADSMNFVQTAQSRQTALSPTEKNIRLALDDSGNVTVRFQKVSLTFICEKGSSTQENRDLTTRSPQRQEVAFLNGLTIKLGVAF